MRTITFTTGATTYRLTLEATGGERDGKAQVCYAFGPDGERPIFLGEDFYCSPLHDPESDESAGCLLAFLTLGRGDTDAEYFEGYSPAQLAFRDGPDREFLAFEAMVLEGSIDC